MNRITTDLINEARTEHYEKVGSAWLVVGTGSMEPLIRPGDRVMVSAVIPEDIRRGDIIVFRRNGNLIGHRVLKLQTAGGRLCFIDKGDNSDTYGSFQEKDVIGKVVVVRKNNRTLWLNTLFGRITGLALLGWFSWVSFVRVKLGSSKYRLFTKLEAALDRVFRLMSNILVTVTSSILYISGHSQSEKYRDLVAKSSGDGTGKII